MTIKTVAIALACIAVALAVGTMLFIVGDCAVTELFNYLEGKFKR